MIPEKRVITEIKIIARKITSPFPNFPKISAKIVFFKKSLLARFSEKKIIPGLITLGIGARDGDGNIFLMKKI